MLLKSPSTRRAWIEIARIVVKACVTVSPSTRRAWIEMRFSPVKAALLTVALHPEGVDRNPGTMPVVDGDIDVALHPEGVDRNF